MSADRFTDQEWSDLITEAETLGKEYGEAAASWFFGREASEADYSAVLKGIEDGDPEIMDTFPISPLAGTWADDLGPNGLYDLLGIDADDDTDCGEILRAFDDAFYLAVSDEIEREARFHLSD